MSKVNNNSSWYVIVNPTSGRGRGLQDWPIINSLLREAGISFESNFTLKKFHIVEMVFEAISKGYRQIILVGGDGTLHEAVCGVMMQKFVSSTDITFALFPVGTGNDWVRMFGLPKMYSDVVRSIVNGRTFLQDVGRVTYYESMVEQTRYLSNVGGVAYDARVSGSVNRLKSKGYKGTWLYILSAVTELIKGKSYRAVVRCDGKEVYRGKLFSSTIGIGKYNGGGLSQTPYAVADDGLFDVTTISKMSLLTLMWRFRALYSGNIYNVKGVQLHRGARVEIESECEIPLELDGENVGVSNFTFEIIERALKFIVSDKFTPPTEEFLS